MTVLSRKADYALLILWYLHGHPEGGCAREIAAQFHLSRAFVANILKELCNRGFVTSHRGVNGGYSLARPVASVSVSDVIEALDEETRMATCTGTTDESCTLMSSCPIQGPIAELHRRLHEVLAGMTLAEMFRPASPPIISLPPPSLVRTPLLRMAAVE